MKDVYVRVVDPYHKGLMKKYILGILSKTREHHTARFLERKSRKMNKKILAQIFRFRLCFQGLH